MKKHKICKILLVILAIFLCVAFYELLGICVAYKKQPEVSNTTKKETKNGSWNECSENTERAVIIEKNPEALLQRVRLIKNAKKEIILSTFAFQSDESGKLILGALHDAADRGVHIRLLVDGIRFIMMLLMKKALEWQVLILLAMRHMKRLCRKMKQKSARWHSSSSSHGSLYSVLL